MVDLMETVPTAGYRQVSDGVCWTCCGRFARFDLTGASCFLRWFPSQPYDWGIK